MAKVTIKPPSLKQEAGVGCGFDQTKKTFGHELHTHRFDLVSVLL